MMHVHVDELVMDKGLICYDKSRKPFTGTYYSMHENGVVGEEVEVRRGLRHGIIRMFNESRVCAKVICWSGTGMATSKYAGIISTIN